MENNNIRLILRGSFQCTPEDWEWKINTIEIKNNHLEFLITNGYQVIGAEIINNIKQYFVSGKGIYQFGMLPKHLQIYHSSFEEANNFIEKLSKELDQSPLYFNVFKADIADIEKE